MYIKTISLQNIRSIDRYEITFERNHYPGWHVVLGDNGSGKSTLIRSIALALVGPSEAVALRQNWKDWLRSDSNDGSIVLDIDNDPDLDKATGQGRQLKKYFISPRLQFKRTDLGQVNLHSQPIGPNDPDPFRYLWGEGGGWFSASYGPYRRFAGGSKDYEKLYYSNPRLAPHLSAFGEDVALTESVAWLKLLHIRNLERKPEGSLLSDLQIFINKGRLLPHGTKLHEVTSEEVIFKDGLGCKVSIEQLSDGYRSVLSMILELVRQMAITYGHDEVTRQIRDGKMEIDLPGVVLIDEIDAHLHPTWQVRIGECLRGYFPKVQFIVTTHSPLICHAAVIGSVWRLPVPGDRSAFAGRVEGQELQRLLYGDILEAYDTTLFGLAGTRSQAAKLYIKRIAELNLKSKHEKLTPIEKKELRKLREAMPLGEMNGSSQNGN